MVPYNVKASDIGCDIIEFSFEHMYVHKNTQKYNFRLIFWKICTKKIFFACESCSTTHVMKH